MSIGRMSGKIMLRTWSKYEYREYRIDVGWKTLAAEDIKQVKKVVDLCVCISETGHVEVVV